jgi:hypothetical protein
VDTPSHSRAFLYFLLFSTLKENQPTSAWDMWELIQDCWKAFQVKLVERMPRVCKAVIKVATL